MADRLTKAIQELQDFPGTWIPGGPRLRRIEALQVLLDASSKAEGHRVPQGAVDAVLRRLGVPREPEVEDTPGMTPVAVSEAPVASHSPPEPKAKKTKKATGKKMNPTMAAAAVRAQKIAEKKRASKPKVKLGHK